MANAQPDGFLPQKKPDGKFAVKIWTSSHGCSNHHFPESLDEVFEENKYILKPEINAKGGRTIDEHFVAEYLQDFAETKKSQIPTITVLLMGDNNIRQFAKKGAFKVFKYTKEIIEAHKGTIHPLLVLGMMPSPRTHAQTSPMSEHIDDILQEAIENLYTDPANCIFAYVCTTSFFTDGNGYVLNKKYFSRDGIHLNKLGAATLAIQIITNAKILADTILTHKH